MDLNNQLLQRAPMPRHEMALEARGQLEHKHRQHLFYKSVKNTLTPCTLSSESCSIRYHNKVQHLDIRQVHDCCNKSVPLYIVARSVGSPLDLLLCALHNWLYRKWFKPYRTDIEYEQFIAKFITPAHIPVNISSASLIDHIHTLNTKICDRVTWVQQRYKVHPSGDPEWDEKLIRDSQFYILQPLFRAMTIILLCEDYDVRVTDIGRVPVRLTLTGIQDGLSQRLRFASIEPRVNKFISNMAVQVSLEVAVKFVLAQVQREIAAFGPRPDPVESTKDFENGCGLLYRGLTHDVRVLGWGDEPIAGRSSTWVDSEQYPEWVGHGARDDKRIFTRMENWERWQALLTAAGLDRMEPRPWHGRRRHSI